MLKTLIPFVVKFLIPAIMEVYNLVKLEIKRRQMEKEKGTTLHYAFLEEQEKIKKSNLKDLIKQ